MYSIDWDVPEPRKGLLGAMDRLVGPGATDAEYGLQAGVPVLAAFSAMCYALALPLDWGILQYVLVGVLAFDISGGVVTNATSTAKRWFHRPGQSRLDKMAFITLHTFHLLLVCWLFGQWDLEWFSISLGLLLGTSLVILWAPLYLQRPLAFTAYGLVLAITGSLLHSIPGLEWFLPLFFLKLLLSHLLLEAPFRP